MHWIDWLIMTLPLFICGFIAIYTRRFVRSVADFMAGGRGAGRFLICTARSEQGSGAAVFVAAFQGFIVSGFTTRWWGVISTPASLLVMVTGYVVYRYRQTRAMTLGQFFEMRYSRGFRLFAGLLGFFAGIVNFGVIPAVGARFMVAFLNFPQNISVVDLVLNFSWHIFHPFSNGFVPYDTHQLVVPTYLLLMGLFLTICVIMTTTAGQVSVILTDCPEGIFSQLFYTFIAIALLIWVFDWGVTKQVLLSTPPGKSLVSPFDSSGLEDFNMWYVLIGIVGGTFYRTIAWQNSHAFNSSAASPHEARMGGVLGSWRNFAAGVMVTLLSVCALTYFQTHTVEIEAAMSNITDPSIKDQMRSPLALTMMLPTGVKGMLLSIALMGIIAGDGIHLHSWGSIFIQDVVVPLRQKPSRKQTLAVMAIFGLLWMIIGTLMLTMVVGPKYGLKLFEPNATGPELTSINQFTNLFWMIEAGWAALGVLLYIPFGFLISSDKPLTPYQHITLLRIGVFGVALWAFMFGWLVPQIKYVQFWWGITEAIFVGGAGICIVAGLYWAKGTTAAAWTALIVGSLGALSGLGVDFYYERFLLKPMYINLFGHAFHMNIPWITFWNMLLASTCYVVVSKLTCRVPHNMDKLLHRGKYSVEPESEVDAAVKGLPAAEEPEAIKSVKGELTQKKPNWFYRILTFGIDDQFSRTDRWITIGITSWSMFWFLVFLVGTIWNLASPWSNDTWATYYLWTGVFLPLAIGGITTIWFTWGCTHDMIVFFRRLREERIDTHDDGTVFHDEENGALAASGNERSPGK